MKALPRLPRRPPLLSALVMLTLASCSERAPSTPPKNVLLITLDTTRPDRMSCYGYEHETTPVIDRIADQGTRFERAVSTAGITPMSHASILTGLNNYRHGMRVFYSEKVSHRLKQSVDTLPEILQQKGWQTAATVSAYPVSEVYGLDQGFDSFDTGLDVESLDLTMQQRHSTEWYEGEKTTTQRRGDATVTQALDWLERKGEQGPWLLWVHMFDVHDLSIVPPAEFAEERGVIYDKKANPLDPDWRERIYDPELAFMDAQVGRLVQWLEDHGQWDETMIVVTADHGQGLKDGKKRHGWMKHRLLYDWSIRVPLVVRIPGEDEGRVVSAQVRTIDIVPTVLEALNVPGREVEGESLLGLMQGRSEKEPRLAYADALNLRDSHAPLKALPPHTRDDLFAVSDGKWKLIYHYRKPARSELFNLERDPAEQDNVAAEHPAIVERLHAFLVERRAMTTEKPGEEDMGEGPSAEALGALGYAGEGAEDDAEEEEK